MQRLCQLINARIEVASQRGQGTTFTIHTPYRWLPDAASPVVLASSSSVAANAPLSLKGKVIAVIEDDPVVCEAYRQTLTSKGAQVILLPDDQPTLLRELELIDHLDLVISDYRLKSTTGDAVIQTLRESFNHEVPAIIVTADTSPIHIHHFQQLNVPVLHKPVSFQQVIDTAERALALAEEHQADVSP